MANSPSTRPIPTVTHSNGCITISGLPVPPPRANLDTSAIAEIAHRYKHLLTHGTSEGKTESQRRKRESKPLENGDFQLPVAYTCSLICSEHNATMVINWIISTAAPALIRVSSDDSTPEVAPAPPTNQLKTPAKSDISNSVTVGPAHNSKDEPAPTDTPGKFSLAISQLFSGSWLRMEKEPEPIIEPGFRKMTEAEMREHFNLWCAQCAQEIGVFLQETYVAATLNGSEPDYYQLPSVPPSHQPKTLVPSERSVVKPSGSTSDDFAALASQVTPQLKASLL